MSYSLFVSCPKGLEYLLQDELVALGLQVTRVSPQGVYGEASLSIIYRLCLWSRIANRVQLILFNGQAHNEQTLYRLCHQFPWQTVFSAENTLAIEFHGTSDQIRNTMYGAQVVKDAIVDHFRALQAQRPMIDRDKPQVLLHAHLKHDQLTLSLDLLGYSLHQRGYRSVSGKAPIKENIAAAMLLRANWPALAAQGYALHDPFCGSGTLVIEACMMAAHIAPGLLRQDQSLRYWRGHQASLWEKMREQALQQMQPRPLQIIGTDVNPKLIAIAKENAQRAGVAALIEFQVAAFHDCQIKNTKGLLIANPPYGERLGDETQLLPLYQKLGQVLHQYDAGWQAAILTSNPMLAKAIGLRSEKQYTLFNGALECKLYCFSLANNQLRTVASGHLSANAQMFANRLKKNLNHLQKWASKNQVDCYRLYDADLPDYAFAIDKYQDYIILQEYAAPATIPTHKVQQRRLDVMQIVPSVLHLSPDHVVLKQRRPQKGKNQYEKLNQSHRTLIVQEGQAKLKVNLYDYIDTGLFLDHRLLRLRFAKLPHGTKFLNCFCYTASASVHAAIAGAITTNVDLSNTYLSWGEENFRLNHIDLSKHQFIQYDVLEWLTLTKDRFDVIFLDPPSFSNSKRMSGILDIQRDHEALIESAMRLLNANGMLYFSTNLRQFRLSPQVMARFSVDDLTTETIDLDFKRDQKIHHCYRITPHRC